jgi:tRNA threonylcarbamoyladenosine biosynthesis protein TsaB
MIVLALDTSTRFTSVAVVDDRGVVLAETTREIPRPASPALEAIDRSSARPARTSGSDLLVTIDATCVGAGVAPIDLDAVAVGAGPGSFTGLRVGMATAKGIAFAARCPLWTASSLAALAQDELADDPGGVVVAVLDARRGEVYAGAFRRDGERVVAVADERVMAPAELVAYAAGARAIVGDYATDAPRTPRAAAVALVAFAGPRVDQLAAGAPTYIRRAEAEIRYPDGVPGALRKR